MTAVIWSKNLSRKNMRIRLKVVEMGPQMLRNLMTVTNRVNHTAFQECRRTGGGGNVAKNSGRSYILDMFLSQNDTEKKTVLGRVGLKEANPAVQDEFF
jgi:hypothetical protein